MLHPQTRALLDVIEQKKIPPTHTLSVADARAYYRDRRSDTQPAPPEVALMRELEMIGPCGPFISSSRTRATSGGAGCVTLRRSR